MCDICVVNAVKNKMLSRRDFFKSSAAVGTVAAVGSAMTGDNLSMRLKSVI